MKDKTATPIVDVVRSQMQADDATDYRAMLARARNPSMATDIAARIDQNACDMGTYTFREWAERPR